MRTTGTWVIVLAMLFGLTSLAGCGGERTGEVRNVGPNTRLVREAGLDFVYDLMTADAHSKMAAALGQKASTATDADRFVSLTIVDRATKQPLTEANVRIVVRNPAGEESVEQAHRMVGQGMAHYMLGFRRGPAGRYTVSSTTELRGKRYEHTVSFKL